MAGQLLTPHGLIICRNRGGFTLFKATAGKSIATTITGSLPRPSWYLSNLNGRVFSNAMADLIFRDNYVDALATYVSDQMRAGIDILTDGDARFDMDLGGRSWFSYLFERMTMNAALAMIEAASPKNEIEAALAVQMACTHTAAMAVLAKLDVAFATERRVAAFGSAAARLLRAYAIQVEVLRRLRNGGQQFVRVEHVHVNDGGQAVIGNVQKPDTAPTS
jgi:hypothetical protein